MSKLLLMLAAAGLVTAPALAAEGSDRVAVSQARINQFSDRITVPFKSDFDFGGGPEEDGFQYKLEIEPVIPFNLSENWSLISRTIVPFITQSNITEGPATGQTGFGDTTQSLFLSPRKKLGGWLSAGLGPAFVIPTSTSTPLGNDRFSVGPTFAVNVQTSSWTVQFLGYQVWSVTGDNSQKQVNKAFLQPSITYTSRTGTNFGINTETECDWLEEGTQCSVPINVTIGHPFRIGEGLDLHITGGARYFAVRTEEDPQWGLRLEIALIFEQ